MRSAAVPLAVAGAILLLLGLRLGAQPLDGYGLNGAEYKQHTDRLRWSQTLQEVRFADPPGPLGERLGRLDGEFPPGLYAFAEGVAPIVGRSAEAVVWTAPLWLLLLAFAVASVGWSLSGLKRVAAAAAVGTLLLPGLHGSATRFYFDLPMTALVWTAVAAFLVLRDERPIAAGVLTSAIALLATSFKWPAVPALAPLLLGAALCGWNARPELRRRRLVALGLATGLWVAGVATWVGASEAPGSLESMVAEASVADLDLEAESTSGGLAAVVSGTLARLVRPGRERQILMRAQWYLATAATSVLSPLLALFGIGLLVVWVRRDRRTWPLLGVALVGHGAFLLLLVAPIDDRFLLPTVPALVVACALGWSAIPVQRLRQGSAIAFVLVGLLVAADFHHGPQTPLTAPLEVWPGTWAARQEVAVPVQSFLVRGIGAASSFERRGWGRQDEAVSQRPALRRRVRDWMAQCRPRRLAALEGAPGVGPTGDHTWLEYELARIATEEANAPDIAIQSYTCEDASAVESGSAVLTRHSPGATSPEPCPPPGDWSVVVVLEDPDGGTDVAVWGEDRSICRHHETGLPQPPSDRQPASSK